MASQHELTPIAVTVKQAAHLLGTNDKQIRRGIHARLPIDPVADVSGEPFVELVKTSWNHEPVMTDVLPVHRGERVGLPTFNRNTGEIYILIFDWGGIALHGDTSFRKDLNCMRASLRGREEFTARVQQALALATKKEAEIIVETVVAALEATLLNNLGTDGFTLEARQLRQVLRATQAGDSTEDSFHGRDDPDEGQAQGQVRQSGQTAAM